MKLKKCKDLVYTGSFSEGVCPILFVSQILGVFPLKGIRPKPSNNIHFSWFSISTLICLGFMICDVVFITTYALVNRNSNISSSLITTYIFFGMGFLIYAVFLRLAMQWVNVIEWWTAKEQRFLEAPYVGITQWKLKNKILTVALVIAFFAAAEHSLHQITTIYGNGIKNKMCNITNETFYEFMSKRFASVHFYIPGTVPLILSQLVSLFATVAWNFLDLFIILISIGITFRFEQHTIALKYHLENETPSEKSMLKFRLDFIAICEMLEYVDKHMGLIIFLSAANNIYFVCSQLLNALNINLRFIAEYIYFWFSLLYLIGRTFYLFLSAAAINESSQGPVSLLYNIPQQFWNQECNRLLFQINSSDIALSAMGFFNFTRGLILTMAGAIVTFELVMLQFVTTDNTLEPLCN